METATVAPLPSLPLAFFEWIPAAVVAAGAAVAIPIIIHLLNRRRFKVVTWAAMRFLLAAQKKNSRRMRIEQLLLLALRCLLVLLLVAAMCSVTGWAESLWRVVVPAGFARGMAGGRRTHKVLVLDGSFSMALKQGDTTSFERARALARQVVEDSSRGDGFSVVLMAAPPRRVVPEPSEDRARVAAEIDKVRLPHGNADLQATLNTVESLLRSSPGKFEDREVYFFTDLQQSTWVARQPGSLAAVLQKIKDRARTVFVDVGQDGVGNTAVTSLSLGQQLPVVGAPTPITATIMNYGEARENVRVELLVGKARAAGGDHPFKLNVFAQKIERRLARGANTVSFEHRFTHPGDYVLQVKVENDSLEVDDVRSATVTVRKEIPVLLVNGKPATEALDRATEWLKLALNPYESGAVPGLVPARPKVVGEKEFNDAGLGDLTPYDCVYFCDVRSFTPAEVKRIEAHLRRGGGAVFCLGPHVDAGNYDEFLYRKGSGLLPARPLGKQEAPGTHFFHLSVEGKAYSEPPLQAFADEIDRFSLTSARFRQYLRTELAPKGQPRKVLSFMPEAVKQGVRDPGLPTGDAAVIEWQPLLPQKERPAEDKPGFPERPGLSGRYRGRVVLFTSTANMDWNSWPGSPSYPAFMQELFAFAVSGRLREQAYAVGEPLEEYLPPSGGQMRVTLRTPDERSHTFDTEPAEEASVLRWADTDLSGVYTATVGDHPQERLFAVNVPAATDSQQASESDLARTSEEELRRTFPEWDNLQVVTDLGDVRHGDGKTADEQENDVIERGREIARWLLLAVLGLLFLEVVLAWQFGHHTAVVAADQPAASGAVLPVLAGLFAVGLIAVTSAVLLHAVWTGDFLSFLPDALRGGVERVLSIEPPAPGESSRWRLEFTPYLWDAGADPWLAGALAVLGGALVVLIYRKEGKAANTAYKLLLAGVRISLILFMLLVLLPRLEVWFERQSWPDVVVIVDDSASMSTVDKYRDPQVQAAADALAQAGNLPSQHRLALAQALLTRENPDWLRHLLTKRKFKLHVYHCSARAHRLADVVEEKELPAAAQAVKGLQADEKNDSSQLGTALRQAVNDFRGSSLAAVVMLTDGVTTEGEDVVKASKYASQMGVPLFFVGIGDAQDIRDLILSDLQVEETVYVNDTVIFQVRFTAQGYTDLEVPITLHEKGKDGREGPALDTKRVRADPHGNSIKVQLKHRPTEAGEKTFVIKVPVQPGEVPDNNKVERTILVRDAKINKVLYVEGAPRWEFRYVKSLLERESARVRGNKAIDLKVLLLEADDGWAASDKSALSDFPTRAELNQFDVVILGDVDPKATPKMHEHLKDIADFVKERGGGLLMIAGERFAPRAYKETPLKDVLPLDIAGPFEEPPDVERVEGYRPELTPAGRMHPIFRFSSDERENDEVFGRLRELYWYAEGYSPKRAAEVLAVHPKLKAKDDGGGAKIDDRHPLVVQQFVGAGRSMFFGFNETWRWRWREDEANFNKFWVQTVRYLAVGRLGRIDLRLDRQTPYRRGEPIKVTVRFPDDSPPPPEGTEVKVLAERRPLRQPGQGENAAKAGPPVEVQTLQLAPVKGSRAAFEGLLTRTPEGEYQFWLSAPPVSTGTRPRAECRVLPPPGELQNLRMNEPDMQKAADESRGRYYTLANADDLLHDLPGGTRVTLNAPGPPAKVWNHGVMFLAALGLLTMEWVLRKRKHLL